MDKRTYNDGLVLKQKSLENLLWEVFWSYSQELGLDESQTEKNEMVAKAKKIIPDFAESATGFEFQFDYPLIYMFIASLRSESNYLKKPELLEFMKIEGPDNDAKLAHLVAQIKSKKA